ncbi:tRNA pseudouridine(38-40) synthase [Exophiala spinifera]|uniref:tRNA pseudouridine synthase 1 n=1 Tax=Exophiala spinifera TaxID=91928 RepID=A0A0D2BAZ0_9EURO|nr:tRNA pseudouridine(38-40) synthase [Exophiala spinifera]KIW15775.1 tRNA pseudouridine(38-40) synthase [Exophiala spinifera]
MGSKNFARGGNRGGGRGRHGKKGDMGRTEWAKTKGDKRQRNDDEQASKRQRVDDGKPELPIYATKFSDEVLAAEERRPKKKVAVLIGYAGTGYRGMQFTHDHKTIEGDLFKAFVAAGAISKANADDPKKSSFVRCARTDKGVHAAGNVISLKLIVEDEDIVKKINDNLVPQIRVWGYERTINSFSAYQMVDSRIYEYLIPTHSFLPPHPSSFLGRALEEWAQKKDDVENYRQRQEEVAGYWEKVDKEIIEPILAEYDDDVRSILQKALWMKTGDPDDPTSDEQVPADLGDIYHESEGKDGHRIELGSSAENGTLSEQILEVGDANKSKGVSGHSKTADEATANEASEKAETADGVDAAKATGKPSRSAILQDAMKRLRQAYITAKRAYRIPKARLDRIQDALNYYKGTRNYHNFTVQKTYDDASAKRVIKSFIVNPEPILINGTEWLSMKVHGQSFMMHQIRKMVAMVALVVRCGCDPSRINDSLGPDNISIPKAPSLGLLLERPVFDSYNRRATSEMSKEAIDFDKYKTEMDAFKQKHIYERMYEDEENMNVFGNFFNHVDNFPIETFMFVTSGGIEATKVPIRHDEKIDREEQALVETDIGDGDSDVDENVRDNHGDEG